jgi:uncharacterized protein (DUF1810 family)
MNGNSKDLDRFLDAQENVYHEVLRELQDGAKVTHWMWFVFPQITGLGFSSTSQYYAIKNAEEARNYLAHPILGPRIVECTETLITHEGLSALDIFGGIDEMKFRSSMTLFAQVGGPKSVYQQALDKYFEGEPDHRTLDILAGI